MSARDVPGDRGLGDLSPRPPRPVRRRKVLPAMALALVALGIAGLLVKTLGDASLFFKNVDEAVAEREALGERRLRVQGTVVPGTVTESEVDQGAAVLFTLGYNGVELDVVHLGNPPELFKDGMPVVLEGHWVRGVPDTDGAVGRVDDGWYFASDRMLVKHDSQYVSEHDARLREAEEGGPDQATISGGYDE